MPKDRFKTRASYDTDFKYGIYEKSQSLNRTVSEEQVRFMKDLYNLSNLTEWERNFIKSVIKYHKLSQKQIDTLKDIYIRRVK